MKLFSISFFLLFNCTSVVLLFLYLSLSLTYTDTDTQRDTETQKLDTHVDQPSTQSQTNGCKSAVLILDRQDRWQLTVKTNLGSCFAPSGGCPGVRGQPAIRLNAFALQRLTPSTQKQTSRRHVMHLHHANHVYSYSYSYSFRE